LHLKGGDAVCGPLDSLDWPLDAVSERSARPGAIGTRKDKVNEVAYQHNWSGVHLHPCARAAGELRHRPTERRQLPPQIRRVELARRSDGKPVVRYQLTVDTGIVDGRRKQFRRRYATEREAREALAEVLGQLAQGSFVQPSQLTVRQACDDWLAAKHGLKPSTVHGHRTSLTPVTVHLGDIAVQDLTKRHIDDLVAALRAGGGPSPRGKTRKPWKPRTVNYMLSLLTAVLEDQMRQGHLVRNVAALVTRVPSDPKPPRTLTAAEVRQVLNHIDGDRYAAAWHLALSGLRRGEIAAIRWPDIDLNSGIIAVSRNRLRFGDKVVEGTVKSKASDRKLPLPDNLAATLKAAKTLQAADKLSVGAAYQSSGYVWLTRLAGR
jgi:integrase